MKARRFFSVLFWILAIGWVAALFTLSTQSGDQSASLSLRVAEYLLRRFPFLGSSVQAFHPILRKLAHACGFALEGFFLAMAAQLSLRRRSRAAALAVAACAALAALNEYSQMFADGRSCEFRDMCIDFGGALAGILAALLIGLCLRRGAKKVII